MSSTTYTDLVGPPIAAAWLNDVNGLTYNKTFPDATHAQTVEATGPQIAAAISANNVTQAAALAEQTGAGLVGYLPAGSGATATTLSAFLSRITSLGNGSASHSDGTNTITGGPRWFIGNGTPSTDDSALLIGRNLTGSYTSGAHGVRDESSYSASGTGLYGYSSFDSIPTFPDDNAWNHVHSYQSRVQYTGIGNIAEVVGLTFQTTVSSTGTVVNNYGVRVMDALGSGPIGNQAALWVDALTRGTNNYVIYSVGAATPSYHAGLWHVGAVVQSDTAVYVGTAAAVNGGVVSVKKNGASQNGVCIQDTNASGGGQLSFLNSGGTLVGSITQNGTATAYNTSSDARLKTNIQPAASASALIDAVKVVSFNWKDGGSHEPFGVIAQDLAAVVPAAVHAGDSDPTAITDTWGVDYSKLVPLLVLEIQSLRARLAAVEARP